MCNPALWVQGGIAAIGLLGSKKAADAQEEGAEADAQGLEYQAALEKDSAQAEAQLIRRQGGRARGETLAGAVASGVKVGEGSALDAERQVMQDYEQDALTMMLTGDRREQVLKRQASARRKGGGQMASASMLGGATSLLQFGGQLSRYQSNGSTIGGN